jgi:ubiquinone/menaquinone biosynthesis C-methylase UbiE
MRFSEEDLIRKNQIWKAPCEHYLQRFVGEEDRVLDLASGYCEFINNIKCGEKYAIDIDPECLKKAKANVHTLQQSCTDLSNFPDDFFDLVFASNIFEHLKSKEELKVRRG